MPELPELQAHAERLSAAFGGRTLTGFRPMTFTALKTVAAGAGRPGRSPARRGRAHGQVPAWSASATTASSCTSCRAGASTPDEKQSAKPRGGLARWTFDDGSALLLTEMAKEKRAGVWVVAGDPTDQVPLAGLGPDAARHHPRRAGRRARGLQVDAGARLPPRPARHRRHRPTPVERDLLAGEGLAVRRHPQAHRRRGRPAPRRPRRRASTRPSPSSAASTP